MADAKGSEGDMMRVAIYSLEWARQAITLVQGSSPDQGSGTHLNQFERDEYYVLKVDHVYKTCRILKGNWPSVFLPSAHNAAETLIQRWTGVGSEQRQLCKGCRSNDYGVREQQEGCGDCKRATQTCYSCEKPVCARHAYYKLFGNELRNAYAHYEEAMGVPGHRLRGEPAGYLTVRGISPPGWARGPFSDRNSLWLLNREYRLDGVSDALIELEREFSAVLTEPDDPWNLRREA